MRSSNDEDLKTKTGGRGGGVGGNEKETDGQTDTAAARQNEEGVGGERGWESGWAKIRTHHDVTTAIPRVLHEHSTSRGLFVSPYAWCRRSMISKALSV